MVRGYCSTTTTTTSAPHGPAVCVRVNIKTRKKKQKGVVLQHRGGSDNLSRLCGSVVAARATHAVGVLDLISILMKVEHLEGSRHYVN